MATDDDRLLDHEYDGIREYDNPLPTWWKLLFYATILLVPLYYWDPFGIGVGPGSTKAYDAEVAQFAAEHPTTTGPTLSDEQFAALATDSRALADGKAVYTANCAVCHRADGGGQIGPNLTDDAWIHGATPAAIHTTISEGVLAKGMPNWGKLLAPEKVDAVTAYVISLKGSNPPNPKAPEGVTP
ncbi:MAG: c-type cytochrome [Gemmatimonadaceae bacterium]|nr:c-type cytochrome [Gemmatimonadaceae bacterium]